MICHDQEILDHNRFHMPWQTLKSICLEKFPTRQDFQENADHDEFWQLRSTWGLASIPKVTCHDRYILLHGELNSQELAKFDQHFVGAFVWSHALIARDWFRFAANDPRLQHQSLCFDKDFNIYSRAWSGTREYRLTLLRMIQSANLLKSCRVTFCHQDNGVHYLSHLFHNTHLKDTTPIHLPDCDSISSDFSATYDTSHYRRCGLDVVLETVFDDSRIHLTEKILRPIACGKPFLLVSTPGSLDFLRSRGFETFGGLLDESYDTIIDPTQRLRAITDVMSTIHAMPTDEKTRLYEQLHAVAARNQQYFFSEQFANMLEDECHHNILQARTEILSDHSLGQRWLANYALISRQIRLGRQPRHQPNERKQLADLIRNLRSLATVNHAVPSQGINTLDFQLLDT